ncbi:MAG: hypothetical protein AMXMBFR13_25810 [Phycisphaerae bacterium]
MSWLTSAELRLGGEVFAPVLIDASIKATVLLLMAVAAAVVLRRSSAAGRHAVWMLALVGALLVPLCTAVLPGWRALPQRAALEMRSPPGHAIVLEESPPTAEKHRFHNREPMPVATALLRTPESGESALRAESHSPVPTPPASATVSPPQPTASRSPAEELRANPWTSWWPVGLLILWSLGVVAVGIPLGLGSVHIWHLRRESKPLGDTPLKQMLHRAAGQVGLRRQVLLLGNPRHAMPMTWGLLRPILLLPAEAEHWPEDRLFDVLLHELAHVKRRDNLTELLARLARMVYWFNPLVWHASRKIVIERERACDDLVLTAGSQPVQYAQHILQIAAQCQRTRLAAAVAIAMARPSGLESRLIAVLDGNRCRREWSATGRAAAVLLMGAVLLPISTIELFAAERQEDATAAVVSDELEPSSALLSPEDRDLQRRVEKYLAVIRAADIFKDADEWVGAVRELIRIGRPAVPRLAVELYRTDNSMVHRAVSIVLRAIGDARAVPALIHALAKAGTGGSDCSVKTEAADLHVFMQEHQIDPWARSMTEGFGVGREVQEMIATLERLTSHCEGHTTFWSYDEEGRRPRQSTPLVDERVRAMRMEVADRWQNWWEANQSGLLDDQQRAWVDEIWPRLIAPYRVDAAKQKRTMTLTLLDESTGRPLPEVDIRVWAFDLTDRRTTDTDGGCTIRLPDSQPGRVFIVARKQGFVPVRLAWKNDEAIPEQYTLKLPRGTSIGGTVLGEKQAAVQGAGVYLLCAQHIDEHARVHIVDEKATTDSAGRWSFAGMPAGATHITCRVDHPDYFCGETYGQYTSVHVDISPFKAQAGQFSLARRHTVEGRVLDAAGDPVTDASVCAYGSTSYTDRRRLVRTGPDGTFRILNVAPGLFYIVVQAAGHAPEQKQIKVPVETAPLEIRLNAASPWSDRIIDKATGQPIPSALVVLDSWRGLRLATWFQVTDDQGRFTWPEPPFDKVSLFIAKTGYESVKVDRSPGETGEPLSLQALLQVQVQARDARTDQPIDLFQLIPGAYQSFMKGPIWSRSSAIPARGGRHTYTFKRRHAGAMVRIEADGYIPAVSRQLEPDERTLTLDFTLERGIGPTGLVRSADGKPAPGAELLVITPSRVTNIFNSRQPEKHRRDHVFVTSGEDGRFVLPAQIEPYGVIVLHDSGWAELTQDQIESAPDVHLQSWGRIEGTSIPTSGSQATARVPLSRSGQGLALGKPQIYYGFGAAEPDADGRFAFDRIPPGEYRLGGSAGDGGWYSYSATGPASGPGVPIQVEAGRTLRIVLGGEGYRPVTGRLEPAVGPEVSAEWPRAEFCVAPYIPPTSKEKPTWRKLSTGLSIQPAGIFTIDRLDTGAHSLRVRVPLVRKANGDHPPVRSLGQLTTSFGVPGAVSDEPLDVGLVAAKIMVDPAVGQPVSTFVRTADSKEMNLGNQHAGKLLLLIHWATWCEPCRAELEHVKSVRAAFREEDLAIVGLNLDEDPAVAEKYVQDAGLPWQQVYLGDWTASSSTQWAGIREIPAILLIDREGKLLARNLRGDTIKTAVRQALSPIHP